MDEKEKVIKFPVQNKRPKRISDISSGKFFSKNSLFVGVGTLVLGVVLINANLSSNPSLSSQGSQGRGIASVTNENDLIWQKKLAQRLADAAPRRIASIGQPPTALENLQFGLLQNYSLRLEDGKISRIEFVRISEEIEPKYIDDRVKFIEENRELFPHEFSQIVPGKVSRTDQEIVETYTLVESGQVKSELAFHLDRYGRFHSLSVNAPQ